MFNLRKTTKYVLSALLVLCFIMPGICMAEDQATPTPGSLLRVDVDRGGGDDQLSVIVEIFLLMTVLSLAPAILIMLTSFTRIVIVLSLMRQAMGTQQAPPNQVLVGLALFLTMYIMTPVWNNINDNALQPYLKKEISQEQALDKALSPIRTFMVKQTREKDLAMLIKVSKTERPKSINDVPTLVLIPSFIISELKTAFQMGFLLYIPFLILDMVISSILLSMGMMMLPPVMISLPFKLMLFVLADGWHLIVGSMVRSFS